MTSVNYYTSLSEEYSLTARIGAIQSLDLHSGGLEETAGARYVALVEHWQGIAQRPLLGLGAGASSNLSANGGLMFASHNQYLQIAFDLGLPALTLFVYLLFRLWNSAKKVDAYRIYGCNPAVVLFIAVTMACLFSNSILHSRVFFVVLGGIFALQFVPAQVNRRNVKVSYARSISA